MPSELLVSFCNSARIRRAGQSRTDRTLALLQSACDRMKDLTTAVLERSLCSLSFSDSGEFTDLSNREFAKPDRDLLYPIFHGISACLGFQRSSYASGATQRLLVAAHLTP